MTNKYLLDEWIDLSCAFYDSDILEDGGGVYPLSVGLN